MTDSSGVAGYSRQFALRQPVTARKPAGNDTFNAKKVSKRPTPWKLRDAAASNEQKASSKTKKTLVDAFKQHGMRLCDGARLNAVGKGVYMLGRVPPTVCMSVTALYLSQNNLRTLDGIEQFTAVRLLSVGGNLIASDKEVARLTALAQLRNLNLMGNPLCDQPNYRLRIVAMLTKLQVLDNSDVTKKERDAAPHVAAQDDALRTMVTQNHFDIQKLQRIAQLIALHKDFYGRVMAGVATGRFDRVPSPSDVVCNVLLFLRVWKYEDALSTQELEALKVQMLTIIVRTHAKLSDHPKAKAKEYLLKLANGSSPRAQRLGGASNDLKQRCASWEEAYGNVISLQQKTIANLHALCEKNRKEMVEYLKELLSMDPRQRNKKIGYQRVQRYEDELEVKPPPCQNPAQAQSWADSRLNERQKASSICSVDTRSSQRQLPPQQQDPDSRERRTEVAYPSFLPPPPSTLAESAYHPLSPGDRGKQKDGTSSYPCASEASAQTTRDRKAHLRSGDFANKSLGEAIHSFKLRDSVPEPSLKPPGATSMPSKIPQVHRVYTMQRSDNFPLPRELAEKQRPPFRPSEQRLRGDREMNRSRQETEVATEFSYSHRRVSSAFTREDLDMTNISEISRASSSPRAHCGDEETYIPIAKSSPSPHNEDQNQSVLAHTTRPTQASQRSESILSAPQAVIPAVPAVVVNDGRLQELEQREEKYIRALMQSEQRELDLRNNLSSVQRKLASYQRTLTHQLHEREAIKAEVAQRTMAVATPRILTRFFIRWIQFYNWSQQVKHVQRKRCFILQHDRFWLWRRKVWLQQELRACRKKQQVRIRRLHFIEWVNVTRVSVIAKRNNTVRETQFQKRILRAWVETVGLSKCSRKLQQARQDEAVQKLQRVCFHEWKRAARYKSSLKKVHNLRWQEFQRTSKQRVLWSWKLYMYSVARPIHERSARLRHRVQRRSAHLHFREWRKFVSIDKMQAFRLRRRVWRRWVEWRRRVQSEKHAAHKEKLTVVRVFFTAWHSTASEQATSRRSLNLAKRYVNRRRLRKLWVHWKYFSMAKRKYTQDSTKAFKHFFMKLLRASWRTWKQRTHANLQRAKAHKYGTLQRHFDAFRAGIRFVRAQKARARMVAHTKQRQQWSLLRRILGGWRRYTMRRNRCRRNSQIVSVHHKQGALNSVWRQWRLLHVEKLTHQLKILRSTYDSAVHEKHELEAHLQAAKDTAVSLSDQIEILHERSKGDDQQVGEIEQKLRLCEERNAALESELKGARSAIERERHAWEDALCEEEDKRESDSIKYRSLAQENQVLQVGMIELKRELEAEKAKVLGVEKVNEDLRAASVETASAHQAELSAAMDKQKELEREITELRGHLKEQETEREDTANRLQEYEKRIASTCEAMNEHEQAHEQENERLRNESANIEAKWKEEQAKNAELNRLLHEKNELILNMTHHCNQVEPTARSHLKPHPGHEHCDARHGNHEDCGRRALRMMAETSCQRHPTSRPGMKPHDKLSTTMAQSHSVGKSKAGKHSLRRAGCAVPVRPLSSCKFEELESPTESNEMTEEALLDQHTSKVHADIRLLQERISKRLEQAPAYAQLPPRLLQRVGRPVFRANREPDSPISSCSSLSDEGSDTAEESQLIDDRIRRARLRRLQTQKQAMVLAVSPAVTRFASRSQLPTPLKAKERENVALAANLTKKKPVRKLNTRTSSDKNQSKTIGKKKITAKQPQRHAGRVLCESSLLLRNKKSRNCQEVCLVSSSLAMQIGPSAVPSSFQPHMMEEIASGRPQVLVDDEVEQATVEANDNEIDDQLTLEVPPVKSPSHTKGGTSPRSPKRSPNKHANLLNIDPTATLAAISARIAIVVPPAESEIARINREALAAVANRALNGRSKGNSSPTRLDCGAVDGPPTASDSTTSSNPSSKGGMTPALYDSVIAEEWVNLHLEASGAFLLPVSEIAQSLTSPGTDDDEVDFDSEAFAFRKGSDGGPLGRAGMDRYSLYRMGMPKDLVDRLYRALYVYTNGFHNIINEIAAHCPPRVEGHVSSNAWLTFLLLLEQCGDGKYEMALLKFKQAAQEAQKQLHENFNQEKLDLQAQLHIADAALTEEATRGMEKSDLIRKLVTETTESNLKIADQQQKLAAQAEQIRLLKLEVLVHEDEEKKLNEFLDDARRDYEVANSERLNALSERFALDEEIRKLSNQLDRVEAEKTNYARRMHETLFMNQALRANNDQLKQDLVVLGMEKDKVIAGKQGLQEQIDSAQAEIVQLQELKAQVDRELVENQRKQGHLEARLQTMKEQYDIEVEHGVRHQQEIGRLTATIDEERVQVGVLEAKCNLLSAEKQNTGMRVQDKLRIERLVNQKLELEATVEANKLDRKRDEEQIYNLRSSLEALDAEMQHNKRVYSSGQQAFLFSERTCEQLRQQTQELEKNYKKAQKNVASLKERFKMYETTAKEQITRLEVEVKVANAQLREITYVNRDNLAQIDQLTKSLTLSEKETTVLKTRIEESEKQVMELETEKEDLQRSKTGLDMASSAARNALNRFILSLQNMLALVKLDEFPLDEAIRELLQMIQDTFGEELQLDHILDEDDKPVEMELEVEEDVTEEERASRQKRAAARRKGIISIDELDGDEGDETGDSTANGGQESTTEQTCSQREVVRMSRFRKSKLDHLVNKLQRDIVLKADLIANLESVVCEQSRQLSHLNTTTRQQARVIVLHECQKGMLQSDLEMTTLMLFKVRTEKQAVEFTLEQVRIDQVLQTNRAFQAEVALATLRREFDMQVIANEDLVGKIWRKYEYDLYMRSLRRSKEVQATVTMTEQHSQTLVPQRNPAMERPRVASLYIPADATGASETLLQKISRATRELLPGVANEMDLHFTGGRPKRSPKHKHHKQSLVRPLASSPRSSRTQLRSQVSQEESRRKHPDKRRSNLSAASVDAGTSTLPKLDDKGGASSPTQIIRHVNEFGTRQDILMSPTRPPFFTESASTRTASTSALSPRPPAPQSPRARKSMPRKLSADKRLLFNHLQLDTQYEERVETANDSAPRIARPSARSPITLPTPTYSSPPASLPTSSSTLRYNRSFLRAGMEVLRNTGSSDSPLLYSDEDDQPSSSDESSGEDEEDPALSPSRLAAAVSGYHREQMALHEAAWEAEANSPRRYSDDKQDDQRVPTEIDEELAMQDQRSPFTPAVLYPILPNQ